MEGAIGLVCSCSLGDGVRHPAKGHRGRYARNSQAGSISLTYGKAVLICRFAAGRSGRRLFDTVD